MEEIGSHASGLTARKHGKALFFFLIYIKIFDILKEYNEKFSEKFCFCFIDFSGDFRRFYFISAAI